MRDVVHLSRRVWLVIMTLRSSGRRPLTGEWQMIVHLAARRRFPRSRAFKWDEVDQTSDFYRKLARATSLGKELLLVSRKTHGRLSKARYEPFLLIAPRLVYLIPLNSIDYALRTQENRLQSVEGDAGYFVSYITHVHKQRLLRVVQLLNSLTYRVTFGGPPITL